MAKKDLRGTGFEPVPANRFELESNALDHSATHARHPDLLTRFSSIYNKKHAQKVRKRALANRQIGC